MLELRREKDQRAVARKAKKCQKRSFEEHLMRNKIASYLRPLSLSSSDDMSDGRTPVLPPSGSQGSSNIHVGTQSVLVRPLEMLEYLITIGFLSILGCELCRQAM